MTTGLALGRVTTDNMHKTQTRSYFGDTIHAAESERADELNWMLQLYDNQRNMQAVFRGSPLHLVGNLCIQGKLQAYH